MALEYTTSVSECLPSAAAGTTVTPVSTAWSNGTYAQISASTSKAYILLGIIAKGGAAAEFEIDIATGASGSEVVIATFRGSNKTSGGTSAPNLIFAPIPVDNIASGVRLAARIRQSSITATAITVKLMLLPSPIVGTQQVTANAYKCLPSAAAGVSVTPSGTSWANSAWVQVTAATANAIVLGAVITTPGAAVPFEIDVGTGASGSEVVVTTVRGNIDSSADNGFICPLEPPLDNIGSGVRVAVRLRKNSTSITAWTVALNYFDKPL